MKKVILYTAAFLTIATAQSCAKKQQYRCVCINTITGDTLSKPFVSATSLSDAEDECDDKESFSLPDRCSAMQ